MAQSSLEKRVTALEQQLAKLSVKSASVPELPWWRRVAGTLTDDAMLDEAMRLGRKYRESLRPGRKRKKGGVKKNGNTRYRSGHSSGSKR